MGDIAFDNDACHIKFASFFRAATHFVWGGDTTTAMLRHATPAVGDRVVTNPGRGHRCRMLQRRGRWRCMSRCRRRSRPLLYVTFILPRPCRLSRHQRNHCRGRSRHATHPCTPHHWWVAGAATLACQIFRYPFSRVKPKIFRNPHSTMAKRQWAWDARILRFLDSRVLLDRQTGLLDCRHFLFGRLLFVCLTVGHFCLVWI